MPYKDINRNRKNILIAFVNILIALAYAIRIFTGLLIVFLSILYKGRCPFYKRSKPN
jgi:hypothetical protein